MGRIHFIAIGGSAMHNLAIALHLSGKEVSGSDDEIFDPAKSRLQKYGLLPSKIGWDKDNITSDLEAVVLGMHAKKDNIELERAKELGIKIYSYPEYLYEASKNQTRIVVGGSHGKTTVSAMVLHVLSLCGKDVNYMLGAQLEGFEVMIRLNPEAEYMLIEGDEYLTSALDPRPKFHLYRPDIALINGIAWDHINVFPTFENYVEQFRIYASLIEPNGKYVYFEQDENAKKIAKYLRETRKDVEIIGFSTPKYEIRGEKTVIEGRELSVFGKHNMQNVEAAYAICSRCGVDRESFLDAIASFKGAARRLELVEKQGERHFYKDFAHSPSKLKATVDALKEQFATHKLIACMELHTFSSLSKEFFSHYAGAMDRADYAFVYFNPKAVEHKGLQAISAQDIKAGFAREDLRVFSSSEDLLETIRGACREVAMRDAALCAEPSRDFAASVLQTELASLETAAAQNAALIDAAASASQKAAVSQDFNVLWMSSGNFDAVDEKALAKELLSI